ncbi:MAG: amidohydrolase family protein [Myxococcales bacterium]|nr:amidohydrolase family protein [Myxococcales bacterium]
MLPTPQKTCQRDRITLRSQRKGVMLDLLIRGGTLIDGTGAEGRRADVGIRDGRVVAVGKCGEPARRTLDATGLVVAPGFIDIHTHYDAQLFWDPAASPSPLYGVTTIVGGNCGFSIAPLRPEATDYLRRMLAKVEGMPLESLEAGLPWDWTSFGDWLSRLDDRVVLNAGFLVGHSALRRVVMGQAAVGETANEAQLAEMVSVLHQALEQGGLGFSSSRAPTHNDGDGNPVPSRFATDEEIVTLAGVTRDHAGTTLEYIPTVGAFQEQHMELMTAMSLAANRPLNWNVLQPSSLLPELHVSQLAASDHAAQRGARVVALTLPQVMTVRLNFRSGFVLDAFPGWAQTLALPLPERIRALQDPEIRSQLKQGAESEQAGPLRVLSHWKRMTIAETFEPANQGLVGRTLGEIAAERGQDPFDVLLDLAVSEDLRTSFTPFIPGDDEKSWRLRAQVWRDPRTLIGASDAGAHLDMTDGFQYTSWLLGTAVRERGLLALEEAVQKLTDAPAALYGIRDRGRIAEGVHADLVLFDAERIAPGPLQTRSDLPANAARLYAEPEGIEHVFVNGTEIVSGKNFTGAQPGTVLRSGRDTETVEIPGGR